VAESVEPTSNGPGCTVVRRGQTDYTPFRRKESETLRTDLRGVPVDVQLEVGLKKAIEWISQRRQDDPAARLAVLVDEACRRYDLSPIQADFLYRHLTQE